MHATQLLNRYRSALMGFAQLWIVLLHCWLLIIPNRPVLGAIEAFVKWNGILGVEMFLFLSGIGVTYSIRKGTLRSFYLARLRRVLVPYWAMIVLSAIAGHHDIAWMLHYLVGTGPFLKDLQGVLWFVPAIIMLYTLFPAYHTLMMRAKNHTVFTLAALALWLSTAILLRGVIREDWWVFINRIPAFLIGIWFGESSRKKEWILTGTHWFLLAFCVWISFRLRRFAPFSPIPYYSFAIAWIFGVPFCFLLAGMFALLERGMAGSLFRCLIRFLSFAGTFTLELYCCHQWVFYKVYSLLEGHISYLGINMISIPTVIAAGWLLHLAHQGFWKLTQRAFS